MKEAFLSSLNLQTYKKDQHWTRWVNVIGVLWVMCLDMQACGP